MTVEDANYLLGLAEVNFGYVFRNMSQQQKIMLVHSWAFGLQDIPADIVTMAFMQLTTSCDWLPNVAKIREQVRKLRAEAKEELEFERSIKELYKLAGDPEPSIEREEERDPAFRRRKAIIRYIVDNTQSLDRGSNLEIGTILSGSYSLPIGNGSAGFIGTGD